MPWRAPPCVCRGRRITRPMEPMEPREPLEQHWVWMKVVKLQNSCFTWKVSFFCSIWPIYIYYYYYLLLLYIYVWLLFVGFDFPVWTTCPTPHERNRTSWWLTCGPIAIRPKGPIVVRLKNMQWPVLSYTSKCFVTQFKKIGCFPLVFVHDYIFLYLQWPVTSWRSPPFSWRVWRDSPLQPGWSVVPAGIFSIVFRRPSTELPWPARYFDLWLGIPEICILYTWSILKLIER